MNPFKAQSGFANTDLDMQLKQHGIENIVLVGMVANTFVECNGDGMHAAHDVNGPFFAHSIMSTEELPTLLPETVKHIGASR
jgi:hypothetical protein